MRRWRERHPEEQRARNRAQKRAHYAKYRDEHNRAMAAYHRAHPEVALVKSQAYRARLRAATGFFTAAEWRALLDRYQGRCGYCGASGRLQADHRIALGRGGTNTIDNTFRHARAVTSEST
jgi:hypothetical protein